MEVVVGIVGVVHIGESLPVVTSSKQFGGEFCGAISIRERVPDNLEAMLVEISRLRKVGVHEDRIAVCSALHAPTQKLIVGYFHTSAETGAFNTLANAILKSVVQDPDRCGRIRVVSEFNVRASPAREHHIGNFNS